MVHSWRQGFVSAFKLAGLGREGYCMLITMIISASEFVLGFEECKGINKHPYSLSVKQVLTQRSVTLVIPSV